MNNVILYLCDKKRCKNCNPNGQCQHTTDIEHSLNFEEPPVYPQHDERFIRTLYDDVDTRIFVEVEK